VLMTQIGLYIARLYADKHDVCNRIANLAQNTAAASSDEEEDLMQLNAVEQKLLAHDPTFAIEDTHAALTTQKSALITAFRPQYPEGDNEGSFVNTQYHQNLTSSI
jgi:hypothetical protein